MKRVSMSAGCKRLLAFVVALGAFATPRSQAQTFSVIYNFGINGQFPLAGLVMDPAGNLYGTTSIGGNSQLGVVFKMTMSGQETVLYNFAGGTDGANPEASLLMDSAGNLYGTTYAGGAYGVGTVFKVTASGQETVLYSFRGGTTDGANPQASLIMDRAGNLYSTTNAGGAYGVGTVFEFSKNNQETVLYSFAGGTDGANPVAGVTLDAKGNLYGTTSAGGTSAYGTVFQLTKVVVASTTSAQLKYAWKESILHNFTHQGDGDVPYAGLIFDGAGNLYGAATGGGANSGGTIFELSPSGEGWNFTVLYSLPGWDISGAFGNLLLDSSGNIWGATHCDGTYEAGTVYELTNSGGSWNYNSMYVFTGGIDGSYVYSALVFDKQGNLYGTTRSGGNDSGFGVVFKITP
jgi:uncharacterized repeat protein (TIGR03803 family)